MKYHEKFLEEPLDEISGASSELTIKNSLEESPKRFLEKHYVRVVQKSKFSKLFVIRQHFPRFLMNFFQEFPTIFFINSFGFYF